MKKNFFVAALLIILLFCACNRTVESTQTPTPQPTQVSIESPEISEIRENQNNTSKKGNIPFTENQWYAVAYLGYGCIENIDYYLENYLDDDNTPTYFFSGGEYYLIIPRYEDMKVRLYRNDLETMGKSLVQECDEGKPFIVQCNISDIFPDVTVELAYQGETVEFSPYISLKDGSIQMGDRGVDITRQLDNPWISLTEEEIRWFNEEFFNTDGNFRRNNFLNCTYEEVKSINLYDIFYNSSEEISKEERKALRGSEIDFGTDFFKLTTSYIDSILLEHMQISLERTDKIGLDSYVYFEEFDAYFNCHGDTNYSSIEVKSGTKDENGNVKLQYLRREDGKEYIVTLKKHANGYYFVSNCEVE